MKYTALFIFFLSVLGFWQCQSTESYQQKTREKIPFNTDWKFFKYRSRDTVDQLIYDVRPEVVNSNDDIPADTKPTEAISVESKQSVLKPWIMPVGNEFLKKNNFSRPQGRPGKDFLFVQSGFEGDSTWEQVDLPHDWAIEGPFMEGWDAPVGGGMARLPSPGVAWYRKSFDIHSSDSGKSIYLDIDGAMSYAMVWLNGNLVGGWPYGYSSFRLDLTPYIIFGDKNQLAIRLDNPPSSSRWYPGGGIYRNVWLVKTNNVHVSHWGTFVKTSDISIESAKVSLDVVLQNDSKELMEVEVNSSIYELDGAGDIGIHPVEEFNDQLVKVVPRGKSSISAELVLKKPKLWGPPPTQEPHLYIIKTEIRKGNELLDVYYTKFGIRSIKYDPEEGILVNDEKVYLKGVNQHHDLGSLGAAFNISAARRQLDALKELGANAIRMAHNPPAPELLDLTDEMGFLVIDELYDCWERKKTPLDFHLIFPDWHEQDLRAMIRRDKNHPSVIMWSTGNEVGEQYTDSAGAKVARILREIANDEDPTRPTTASLNYARPHMPLPGELEVINLNYQGEGIRDAPAYAHLKHKGITTSPLYPKFHEKFPDKVIISSENAAALSSRGTYVFPVTSEMSSPISDGVGGDSKNSYVSAYELYTADFGSSADKVFASLDKHPYVAGGFVWSGWDYLGEPTPYYNARSSYYGLIDLAGFKKDRFYLYQSRWRPDLPMVHILPHWNWPGRLGEVTPIHVFTSGDEVELFLNGQSLGKKKKAEFEYRLRWDDVEYAPGELKAIAYKNGAPWAEELVSTTGEPFSIELITGNEVIKTYEDELAFVRVEIRDKNGLLVPNASNNLQFSIEGPGEIVATDNGDPTDMATFSSERRNAFNGLLLVIVKGMKNHQGDLLVTATSQGLESATIKIKTQ